MNGDILSPAISRHIDRATGLILRQSANPSPCPPGTYWSAHPADALCMMTVGDTPEQAIAKWLAQYGEAERAAA